MGYLGMVLLAAKGAVNVEKIYVQCNIGYFCSWRWRRNRSTDAAKSVARKVYREFFPFFDAMVSHKMNTADGADVVPDVLDMLKIKKSNFDNITEFEQDPEAIYTVYRKELRRLIRSTM
jgi:hypothetical protein